MDGKLGLILGVAIGAALGAGGTYMAFNAGAPPEIAAETQDPIIVVKTQVVTIAASPREEVPRNDSDADQGITFRPQDDGVASTNGNRWGGNWPERGSPEWSNRVAQFRAEMTNRFAQFRAEWTNRAAADRTNFMAKVNLNENQAVRFDVLMTAMNVRLAAVLDPLVAEMQSGHFPRLSSEERARLAYEVGGALVNTYDEMNRSMPEGWNDVASSNHVSVSHFIQPQYQMFTRSVTGSRGGFGDRGPGTFGGGGFGGGRGGGDRGGQPGGAPQGTPQR